MNLHHVARTAGLSLFCALFFCACAAAEPPSLSNAEKFDAYRIYYAGNEAAGLQLEDVGEEEWESNPQARSWTFFYGTCELPEGEGGCSPPIQIQNHSTCNRWFSALSGKHRRLYDFRGAKATGGGGEIEVSPMEIFTGRTTVVIFGDNRSVIKAAARQLRRVGQTQPAPLSPPAAGSLRGKLACQVKPG